MVYDASICSKKHKIILRFYPFELQPESDDCDQGSYFDEEDELEDWEDYSE